MDRLQMRLAALLPNLPVPLQNLAVREVIRTVLQHFEQCYDRNLAAEKTVDLTDEVIHECVANSFRKLKKAFLDGEDLSSFVDEPIKGPAEARNRNELANRIELQIAERSITELCSAICKQLYAKNDLLPETGGVIEATSIPDVVSHPLCYGMAVPVPEWIPEWIENSGGSEEKLLLDALEGGRENICFDKEGIVITGSLDFGIKRVEAIRKKSEHEVFPVVGDAFTSKIPPYYRSITIYNNGSDAVTLLEVRAVPIMEHSFTIHHDLAVPPEEGKFTKESTTNIAVLLKPKSEYQVTVKLKCETQDPAFLQHWLLLTFAKDSPTKSLFVIGRQVTVIAARHERDIYHCLSTEAKPFYPESLWKLFDNPPTNFFCAQPPAVLPWMEALRLPAVPAHSLANLPSSCSFQSLLPSIPTLPTDVAHLEPSAPELVPPVQPSLGLFNNVQYRSPFLSIEAPPFYPFHRPLVHPEFYGQSFPLLSSQHVPLANQQLNSVVAPRPLQPQFAGYYRALTSNASQANSMAFPNNHSRPPPTSSNLINLAAQPIRPPMHDILAMPGGPLSPMVPIQPQLTTAPPVLSHRPTKSRRKHQRYDSVHPYVHKGEVYYGGNRVRQHKEPIFEGFAGRGPTGGPHSSEHQITNDVRPSNGAVTQCPCITKQLRQMERLLALEEVIMERDIRRYSLFNVHLSLWRAPPTRTTNLRFFLLEVPGLTENRPSVLHGDVVYLRSARVPSVECAAYVHVVELRPVPRLFLSLATDYLQCLLCTSHFTESALARVEKERFHVRFSFDRLFMRRMHAALNLVSKSEVQLMPCLCERKESSNKEISLPNSLDLDTPSFENQERLRRDLHMPPLQLINSQLNQEQQRAVGKLLEARQGSDPFIIFGPPGTGKTLTVVEAVLQLLPRDPSYRICLCAPANFAADILCSRIADAGVTPNEMWRMNDPRRMPASVKADIIRTMGGRKRNFCILNEELNLFDLHSSPHQLRVIVCTCAAAALLHELPIFSGMSFTHILIDEAGQALIPETLIPFSLAKKDTRLLLCGDPQQLGPVVHSGLAVANGLSQSLLERFMHSPGYRNDELVTKLLHNYRSHSKLLELPSRLFYDDELIATAKSEDVEPPSEWEELSGRDFPMLFYGVKGQQMRDGESPSLFNPIEAARVVELLMGLLKNGHVVPSDIGVMAPYRSQVQKLRLLLREHNLASVRVGTVDDYQGQEEKVIFITTVLTRLKQGSTQEGSIDSQTGLLGNAKRFNVAITRAKSLLVVVGHPLILLEDPHWRELLKYCLARDAYRGAGSESVPRYLPVTESNKWRDSPDGQLWEGQGSEGLGSEDQGLEGQGLEGQGLEGQGLEGGGSEGRGSEGVEEVEVRGEEDREIARAIERIAELSLLGLGDQRRMFPETLADMYAAFDEEAEFRIAV